MGCEWEQFAAEDPLGFKQARAIADEIKRLRSQIEMHAEARHFLDVALLALGDAVLRHIDD
jgi:hypothetical protein